MEALRETLEAEFQREAESYAMPTENGDAHSLQYNVEQLQAAHVAILNAYTDMDAAALADAERELYEVTSMALSTEGIEREVSEEDQEEEKENYLNILKAQKNAVALPKAAYLIQRICDALDYTPPAQGTNGTGSVGEVAGLTLEQTLTLLHAVNEHIGHDAELKVKDDTLQAALDSITPHVEALKVLVGCYENGCEGIDAHDEVFAVIIEEVERVMEEPLMSLNANNGNGANRGGRRGGRRVSRRRVSRRRVSRRRVSRRGGRRTSRRGRKGRRSTRRRQ
jgi:hypothetical protein